METENPAETFAVTTDVPSGISSGFYVETAEEAFAAFNEAAKGSYPNGTVVTAWAGDEEVFQATVTEETKAAARAEYQASVAAIVAKANERSAKAFA